MSLTGSIELLIASLRADADPREWLDRARAANAERLTISAIVLGLAPLLHWRLDDWNLHLPARAEAKLRAAREASSARQLAIEAQLSELLAACASQQIEVIVLKGAYLAAFVYPDAGLRPMNDIDIMVRADQLPAVEKILTSLNYVGHYKSAESGARVVKHTSSFRKASGNAATANPYLSADSERTIEPHISLEESWYGLRADITPGVWERSVAIDYGGHAARALSLPDLMLHLSIHLTFHLIMGWASLVQLLDLLMVSRRLRDSDWKAMVARAHERQVSGYIYAALRLAQTTLAAPIPMHVLSALASATPSRVRAHAETLSLKNVIERTQKPPFASIAQRLRRGAQDRAETARWASTLGERWNVWRTLLDVASTDTGRTILDKAAQRIGRRG